MILKEKVLKVTSKKEFYTKSRKKEGWIMYGRCPLQIVVDCWP